MFNLKRLIYCPAIILACVLVLSLMTSCGEKQPTSIKPYLVLYAFDAEGRLLSHEMAITDSSIILGRTVYLGKLEGKEIVLAESGVGMTNAAMTTQSMIERFNPAAVIFTGIAGAVDTGVQIGDIVVCDQWYTHDYGYHGKDGFMVTDIDVYNSETDSVTAMEKFTTDAAMLEVAKGLADHGFEFGKIGERSPKLLIGGVGVSGNCFIDSREKRIWLSEEFSALVTDMESAAVGQVCTANSLPFIVFRSASDLAGGSGSETAGDELVQFFNIAADNSSRVVIEFLSRL